MTRRPSGVHIQAIVAALQAAVWSSWLYRGREMLQRSQKPLVTSGGTRVWLTSVTYHHWQTPVSSLMND